MLLIINGGTMKIYLTDLIGLESTLGFKRE